MARPNKKGRSAGDARHVRLYRYLTGSEAWCDLDTVARCAYVELSMRYDGSNNGRIPFSTREMGRALKVSKQTAMRAFRSLQDHGFVNQTKAAFFGYKVRHAPEWKITEHAFDTAVPTKEFMRWKKKTVPPEAPNGARHGTERGTSRNAPPA